MFVASPFQMPLGLLRGSLVFFLLTWKLCPPLQNITFLLSRVIGIVSMITFKYPSEVSNAVFTLSIVSCLKCHAVTSQSIHPMWSSASSFLLPSVCLPLVSLCFQLARLYPAPSSDAVLRAGAVAWLLGTWKKGIVWCLAQRSMTPLSEMLLSFSGLGFLHWTLYLSVQPAHSGYFSLNLCPVLVAAMIPSPVCLLLTQIPQSQCCLFSERPQLLCTEVDRSGEKKEIQGVVRV